MSASLRRLIIPWCYITRFADNHVPYEAQKALVVRGVEPICGNCGADFATLRNLWIHSEKCDGLNWDERRIYLFRRRLIERIMRQNYAAIDGMFLGTARYEAMERQLANLNLLKLFRGEEPYPSEERY